MNIKQKLTSRKLWVAVAGLITGIVLVATGKTVEGTTTITASIIGYLVAEGFIDATAVKNVLTIDQVVDGVEVVVDSAENKTEE